MSEQPPAPVPAGRLDDGPVGRELRLERRFRAPVDDVWAAITESERLERWIGLWEGDPRSGRVAFRPTAEGEDALAEEVEILDCAPPRRLEVITTTGRQRWRLRLELDHAGGVTTLLFAMLLDEGEAIGAVGPGWEYYLDRLLVAFGGGDPSAVDWDDYYPAMEGYYLGLLGGRGG